MTKWMSVDVPIEQHQGTQAFKKMAHYFENFVINQDSSRENMNVLREKYKITMREDDEGWDYLTTKDPRPNLVRDVKIVCSKYKLSADFAPIVINYLHHNEVKYPFDTVNGLCVIENGKEDFPIVLKISPYASETDILKFVHQVYRTQIRPIQNKNRDESCRIGKVRKREKAVTERKERIVKMHREGFTAKKIVEELTEVMSEGEVRNAIASEEKERKQL